MNDTIKFTESAPVSEWLIATDTGWEPISHSHKTIPYQVWELKTHQGLTLKCADFHRVFDSEIQPVFVKDLNASDDICVNGAIDAVTSVEVTTEVVPMYDLTVDSPNHRFYTNDILSHNTTTAAGYLLWYAMFVPNSTILIAAHKYIGAQEIMQRVRYGYESVPNHIRAGVVSYNKGSLEFENGSRIISQTTTETTGRGMSISCLFCLGGDTTVTVRNKTQGDLTKISLQSLHKTLNTTDNFSENTEYEILTPQGWCDFRGILATPNKELYKITLSDNLYVEATAEHCFFKNGTKITVSNLKVGEVIDATTGLLQIQSIDAIGVATVYDVVEVDNTDHSFVVNDVVITKNCDEFSFVRPSIAREFWTSISPTLSTGGKAIITSTPSSDEDQFATIWRQANKCQDEWGNVTDVGSNGFKAFQAYWDEHPDRDQAWADRERAKIGHDRFEREFNCRFVTADETLISGECLLTLQSQEPQFIQGQIRWYKKPEHNGTYVVALDPSLGTGGDPAAIEVFEVPSMIQVAEWQHNRTPITKQISVMRDIIKYLNESTDSTSIYYSVENNTLGEAALQAINEIGEENIPGIFLSEPSKSGGKRNRKGFTTTHQSKISACAKLKNLVENQRIHIKSKNLVSELKTFVSAGSSFAAKPGETDDLVLSTLLIIRMTQFLKQYNPELEQQLSDRDDDLIMPMPFIAVF